ncbi:Glutamate/aspartate import solute-binding protein [Trichinella spiralis]|uniref:Glutamate/aspartate import solute-binding protein n=1 Tax=Trichinella spiralis TaxID=6334 RepID=A0ABR3KXR0_TRISP
MTVTCLNCIQRKCLQQIPTSIYTRIYYKCCQSILILSAISITLFHLPALGSSFDKVVKDFIIILGNEEIKKDRKKISHFNFRSIFLRIAEEAEDSLDQWPIVMALSKATEKMEEASVGI